MTPPEQKRLVEEIADAARRLDGHCTGDCSCADGDECLSSRIPRIANDLRTLSATLGQHCPRCDGTGTISDSQGRPETCDGPIHCTQPVPQPPGATCEVNVERELGSDSIGGPGYRFEPCGNLLPCSTHPTKDCMGVGEHEPVKREGEDGVTHCLHCGQIRPSGDVVRDEE